MSFFLDMLIILSTVHKVLFAKVALQMNSKKDRQAAFPQENRELELRNLGDLTAPWLGTHGCEKQPGPEAHGQESEPSR